MKRFLIVLAVVAVGAALYVAAAPGSQMAGPTAAQFAALKKQVAILQKQVKSVKSEAAFLDSFIGTCMIHQPLGVNRVGTSTSGYLFGAPGTPPASATATTALDVASSGTPQYRLFQLNTSVADCVTLVNNALGHRPGGLFHH